MLMLQILKGLVWLVSAILIWVLMFCAFIGVGIYFMCRSKHYTDQFFAELHSDELY